MNELERDIEKYFVNEIKKIGCRSVKFTAPGRRGVPDRIVFLGSGQIDFVELKTKNGKLTKLQELEHTALKKYGCNVLTLHGKEQVKAYIDKIKNYVKS